MSKVHVISDTHFGHENIARRRGFSSALDHDKYIIDKWNSKITKRDVVWMLGDITMEKSAYGILNSLNGLKKVILGNHDKPAHVRMLMDYVNCVAGMVKYKSKAWLTHAPMHPQELRELINIHGHVHEKSIPDDRYINVCCDVVDYTPVLMDELLENHKPAK